MKTAAAITALAVVGSIAYAAGKDDVRQPRLPGSERTDAADHAPAAAAAASCEPTSAEPWFEPVFRPISTVPGCQVPNYASQPFNAADVNGDGTMDYFVAMDQGIVSEYEPTTGCAVGRSRMTEVAGEMVESYACILSATSVGASVLQRYGGLVQALLFPQGWRDMDADGDLDLVVTIVAVYPEQNLSIAGWLKNIGYEKSPPPLAADLNHDGNVDGVDLGLLLAAWGT
jgi:hypothetical protein